MVVVDADVVVAVFVIFAIRRLLVAAAAAVTDSSASHDRMKQYWAPLEQRQGASAAAFIVFGTYSPRLAEGRGSVRSSLSASVSACWRFVFISSWR